MFCPQSIPQIYEITIKGQLPHDWEDWFEGMKIADQAELFGLLIKIRDLGLILINVRNLSSTI